MAQGSRVNQQPDGLTAEKIRRAVRQFEAARKAKVAMANHSGNIPNYNKPLVEKSWRERMSDALDHVNDLMLEPLDKMISYGTRHMPLFTVLYNGIVGVCLLAMCTPFIIGVKIHQRVTKSRREADAVFSGMGGQGASDGQGASR